MKTWCLPFGLHLSRLVLVYVACMLALLGVYACLTCRSTVGDWQNADVAVGRISLGSD